MHTYALHLLTFGPAGPVSPRSPFPGGPWSPFSPCAKRRRRRGELLLFSCKKKQGVMQNCWSKLSSLFNVSTRPAVHLLNMRRAFGSPHVIHIQHDSSAFSRARLLNIFKRRNVNTDAESARGTHEMWQGRENRQQRSETLFLKVDDLKFLILNFDLTENSQ